MPARDADSCGIAAALGSLGDPWSVLVLRDLARGHSRFDGLLAESGISRKTLTLRLRALVTDGLVARQPYQTHPERFDYLLTERGRAVLPVLAALQEYGDTWLLGDGRPTLRASHERLDGLIGTPVPLRARPDPVVAGAAYTVIYCYPGTGVPGLAELAGGVGCTLESCTYRDRLEEFARLGAAVVGVSTQTEAEQAAFAAHNAIAFPLLSDADLELTSALRLPTTRVAAVPRLHRLTLVVDDRRIIRGVLHPITDVTGSVEDALALVGRLRADDRDQSSEAS